MAAMTDEKQITGSGQYPATGTTGPGKPTGSQEKESHCCLSQQCLANIAIQVRGSRARKEGRRGSLHSTWQNKASLSHYEPLEIFEVHFVEHSSPVLDERVHQ